MVVEGKIQGSEPHITLHFLYSSEIKKHVRRSQNTQCIFFHTFLIFFAFNISHFEVCLIFIGYEKHNTYIMTCS